VVAVLESGSGVPVLVGEHGVGVSAVARGVVLAAQRPGAPGWLADAEAWEFDARGVLPQAPGDSAVDSAGALVAHARSMGNALLLLANAFTPVLTSSDQERAIAYLEPVLTGRDMRVIAAATPAEYQTWATGGGPLAAALRVIEVDELPEEAAVEVLRESRERWESRYRVSVSDEAIAAAVALSGREDPGRPLPGRAMDLLERAAARASERTPKSRLEEARDLVAEIRKRKEGFIDAMDFEAAAAERDRERQQLAAIRELESDSESENMPDYPIVSVTKDDVLEAMG
jgi:ATP-dependent Clp protease ATP-binding subunit ClpC